MYLTPGPAGDGPLGPAGDGPLIPGPIGAPGAWGLIPIPGAGPRGGGPPGPGALGRARPGKKYKTKHDQ